MVGVPYKNTHSMYFLPLRPCLDGFTGIVITRRENGYLLSNDYVFYVGSEKYPHISPLMEIPMSEFLAVFRQAMLDMIQNVRQLAAGEETPC